MEQLPKIVRERLQAGTKPEVHPDPDLLTAFAENSLTEGERLPVLEHLSSCADCREVVALAQPEQVMEHVAAAASIAASLPSRPRWSSRLIFSGGAVAACVVIGVVLLSYQTRERRFAQLASKQTVPESTVGQTLEAEQSLAKAQTQSAASPPENELAAKLEPPASIESKSANRRGYVRADKNSNPTASDRIPSQLMRKKLGAAGAIGGQVAGASASPVPRMREQVTVTSEAAEVASTVSNQDLPQQARSPAAIAANKDSAVAVAPPAVPQKESKPAAPASASAAASRTGMELDSISAFSAQKSKLESAQAVAHNRESALAQVSSNYIPTRWSISSDGTTLLHSTDEGRSWEAVNVASNVVLRALAALGPEIWAGGKAGALYHSSDLGLHWTQLKPAVNGVALTADIVSIDFPDPEHGKLTTAEGKVWTTNDGGKTWQAR